MCVDRHKQEMVPAVTLRCAALIPPLTGLITSRRLSVQSACAAAVVVRCGFRFGEFDFLGEVFFGRTCRQKGHGRFDHIGRNTVDRFPVSSPVEAEETVKSSG